MLADVLPLVVPDQTLSDLAAKKHEAVQNLVTLTNDYSSSSKIVVTRTQNTIDTLNREINDRVNGVMTGLETQVDSQKAALDAMTDLSEQRGRHKPALL